MNNEKENIQDNALKGMVNIRHQKPQELQRQDAIVNDLSWYDIDKAKMPYKGMFYPEEWRIKVRIALGLEISTFSMMTVEDPLSVHEAMSAILKSCIRIEGGKGENLSWKNLFEFDKIYLVMYVRDISMKKPEQKLLITDTCPYCKEKNDIEFNYDNMQFAPVTEFGKKYFDKDRNGFVVRTKSFGEIFIQPSNFYSAELFKNWVLDQNRARKSFDSNFSKMYWLFINSENQHNKNAMDIAMSEYTKAKHNTSLFSIYSKIYREIKIEPSNNILYKCPNESCGEEVHTPITFPNGLENIFLDTDLDSELL